MNKSMSIIFDNGSGLTKAGYSHDDTPRAIFPSIVARSDDDDRFADVYVGDEVLQCKEELEIKHPIIQGIAVDFDDLELIWHRTYYLELRVAPEEHPVLLTDTGLTLPNYREHLAEIMIETFNAPAIYIASQSVLSVFATGNISGVVLDSGHGITHSVVVNEGYMITSASHRLELGGININDYLKKLLNKHPQARKFIENEQVINDIKENHCYVATEPLDYSLAENNTYTYTLPDGEEINLGAERNECLETMFQPSLLEVDSAGVDEMLLNTLNRTDEELYPVMCQNVQLSGGNTMYPGFAERVKHHFKANLPADVEFKFNAPPRRMLTAWTGGSVLSSVSTFQTMWMTSQDYYESGANLVHTKFF